MTTALAQQLEALRTPAPVLARKRHFPIGPSVQRLKDALKRRQAHQVRMLIHQDHAAALVRDAWPAEGESVHAIVPGDFVFGDIIPAVIRAHGAPEHLWLTTLSLSADNVAMLRETLRSCPVSLVVSAYFKATSKEIFAGLESLRSVQGFRLCIARTHTKLMLWHYEHEPVVIESSANLRSNNSIEQLALHQSAPLFFFHVEWLQRLWALAEGGSDFARL